MLEVVVFKEFAVLAESRDSSMKIPCCGMVLSSFCVSPKVEN
jgi:hypothetical protein